MTLAVADPGFPIGGVHPLGGAVDFRHGHFLVKMYAKTKELGPIGGGVRPARPLDPPMIRIVTTLYVDVAYILSRNITAFIQNIRNF